MFTMTRDKLKEILDYDGSTGIFKWKCTGSGIRKNLIAGSIDAQGYVIIRTKEKAHKAHRLAWMYVYGYYPENYLDHIDRVRSNNKINNLREVSNQCNQRNRGNPKNNTSGVKGVSFKSQYSLWEASIRIENRYYYLGASKSFDEAVCLRLAAEQCLGWEGCDSSSPAYKYVKKMLSC